MASSRQQFYTTQKIGPKRSKTPEGFLLCEEVAVARTGMMIYGPDETPIKAGPDGIVKIFREEQDVFAPETIASANGKSVTDDHPEEDVVPDNWRQLTVGFMVNPRRGEKAMDDLLLADLLITTPEGIQAVESDKCEVSLGYDADYEETAPGVGKQSNIIINHVALVEQGRCGPRCAIGDKKTVKEPNVPNNKFMDALRRAFKAKDAAELEAIEKEVTDQLGETIPPGASGGEAETHIHLHTGGGTSGSGTGDEGEPMAGRVQFSDQDIHEFMERNDSEHAEMRSRIEALEAALAGGGPGPTGDEAEEQELAAAMKDEVPEEVAEQAAKAKDSAFLGESFQDTVAMAEILVPGIRVPVYDRAAKPGQTFKKICGLRKQALDIAYVQPATRAVIEDLLGGKALDTKNMTCDAARILFKGAAAAQRAANNAGKKGTTDAGGVRTGAKTIADINAMNRKRYENN